MVLVFACGFAYCRICLKELTESCCLKLILSLQSELYFLGFEHWQEVSIVPALLSLAVKALLTLPGTVRAMATIEDKPCFALCQAHV